ncbi:MAG: hypothetical protein II404_14585 [Prevotella sp.]|nr:hypothetical protein [Prevotella sp.]
MTEGRKMFLSVMAIFLIYAAIFILFEDYDRSEFSPFTEPSDWHLIIFSLIVMIGLGWVLHRYAQHMDKRISREQAAKENEMRRQLTNNIAHELKTPTASILGYTETIMEHPNLDAETKRQFVERTHSQAMRLTALLQDISTLNRIDHAPDQLMKERTDVSHLFYDVVQETAHTLSQRHQTLRNCLPGDIIINGNASLLYSLFRNLVDNAANYAGEGARIEISATEQPRQWEFVFEDNGPGISKEHLPRIFERFYRIDKGRSRALGGTGLGLAIVKNAVLLHGGSIKAQSADPHGLRFVFTLKK